MNETAMRDRLIELLNEVGKNILNYPTDNFTSYLADHLIANGVILPPCKVGDTVYAVSDKQIKECKVEHFNFESAECFEATVYFNCDMNCESCYFNAYSQAYSSGEWDCDNAFGHSSISINEFGKTVFLTKEEAEKALKEKEK